MKNITKIIGIFLIAVNVITAGINIYLLRDEIFIRKLNNAETTLNITVLDGRTGACIPSAKVVLPQINKAFIANDKGNINDINLPLFRDSSYDKTLEKQCGNIMVLAYSEGYYDYALFDLQMYADQSRNITIYMFTNDGSLDAPFTLVEGPGKEWTMRLLAKYKNLSP